MSLARAGLLLLLLAPLAPPARAASASYDPDAQTWKLANALIEARFFLAQDGTFRFIDLTDRPRRRLWAAPTSEGTAPVRLSIASIFELDEKTPYDLVTHWTAPLEGRGVRQYILLQARNLALQVEFIAEVWDGQPFLRHQALIRNFGGGPLRVTAADLLPWKFADDGLRYRSFHTRQWSWAEPPVNFEPLETDLFRNPAGAAMYAGSAARDAAWLALRDNRNRGLVFGWEFDGRASVTASHDREQGILRLAGSIEDLNHRLWPGEQLALPAAFAGVYQGDWDEAAYRTQRFVEATLARQPASREDFPYVGFDSWGYQWDIDEGVLLEAAAKSADLGVELFTVDFGWAEQTGDWIPDPGRFPRGLRPLADYVHALGMKFGLHLPFAEAMESSRVLRDHPDWAVVPAPDEYRFYFDAQGLCLAHRPVRDWVIGEILRVVRENGVDWLLQDGENMVKQCLAAHHTHLPGDSNFANARALAEIIDTVQRAEPALMWENCANGGTMQTYGMARRYVTSIAADNTDPLATRQAVWGATFAFPPRYTARYMEVTPWNTLFTRSHFFGGPLILMDAITRWPEEITAFMKREIGVYKSIRGHIRDGKVFRLTPRPDGSFNDAIQSHDPATGRSIVLVYRQESAAALERVRPRGLDPGRSYRVRFQDNPRTWAISGRDLIERGVEVELPEPDSAEIVYLDPE